MNIVVFDNLLFFPQRSKTESLETQNFLHFLFEDPYFQNELKTLRKKYNIPEGGYPIQKLYETVEIQDYVIDELSFERLEEFHRLLDEIFNSNDVIFAPNDQVRGAIDKKKGKYDQFYQSLSEVEQKAIDNYFIKHQKADNKIISYDKDSQYNFSIQKLQKTMQADLDQVIMHYKLSSDFRRQFFMLITFNAFQNIQPFDPFLFMASKEDILDEVEKTKEPIGALLIYEKITQHQLVKWIENNWEIIQEFMKDLPHTTYQRSTILDISKEIADLRDSKGMKFREIALALTDKYPKDLRVTDETWIKETYNRYKDRLRAFTHKK